MLPYLVALFAATASAAAVGGGAAQKCRYIPGDVGWPSRREWEHLNATVGGRLIATVPVAHVCHETGPFAAYNETACEDLGRAFQNDGAATLLVLP